VTLLATALPFLLLLVLTVVIRRPLWQSGLISFGSAVILWLLVSDVETGDLAPPTVKAFIVSTEVGLILLGAISFLEAMNRRGTTERIKVALAGFTSGNRALEALLLAWLFCGFLEGAAGFGAPAALVAPWLHTIGFSPLTAAVLPLIGDSAAVPFGAVGTPVRVGFDGLPSAAAAPFGAGINLVAGLIPPLAIYLLALRSGNAESRTRFDRRGVLLSLWAGVCFTVPAFLLVWIGPEFPSLAGALMGLLIFSFTLMHLPGDEGGSEPNGGRLKHLVSAFFPYLLLCLVLLIGKLTLGNLRIRFEVGGHVENLNAFQPGLLFLVTIVVIQFADREGRVKSFGEILVPAAKRLPFVWLAIFCMASLAQFVVQISDPVEALGGVFREDGGGFLLVFLAPLAGAAGAFMAGSATVSNLLMAPLLYQASALTGADPGLILGLQLVGAGAGNMVSLQNLAAVQATVGLVNREREMLQRLWLPCAAYLGIAILLGLMLSGLGGVRPH